MMPIARAGCVVRAGFALLASRAFSSSSPYVSRVTETLSILRSRAGAGAGASVNEVYLIGTAHVSAASAKEVRELVRVVKPASVMVELCEERLRDMRQNMAVARRQSSSGKASTPNRSTRTFMVQAARDFASAFGGGGDARDGLLGAALKTMYGFFKLSGLEAGGEFIAAVEEADAMGAVIVCGDRDVRETLRRVRENLSFGDVVNMATGYEKPGGPPRPHCMEGEMGDVESVVESLKSRANIAQMRAFMRYQMPHITRAFMDERDEIMADALIHRCQGERVVAVVGMAHMEGIEQIWDAAQSQSFQGSRLVS